MKKSVIVLALGSMIFSSAALGQSLSERMNYVAQKRQSADRNSSSTGLILGVLLYTDISVQFQEMPARDALSYIQNLLGINIIGRYNDDRTAEGIDPEAPITLDASNRPALTVLELVLAQCEEFEPVTWQIRRGYVEVGTKARLAVPAAQEIRYYPIRDGAQQSLSHSITSRFR